MNKKNIGLILSLLMLSGCAEPATSSLSLPPSSTSEEVIFEDDSAIEIPREEKTVVASTIVASDLQSKYFKNDVVSLANVKLAYYDNAFVCETVKATFPDQHMQTGLTITVDQLGSYQLDFEVELYAEILTATFTFTVENYDPIYQNINPVNPTPISVYRDKLYRPDASVIGDLFGRKVECQYLHAISPAHITITEAEFVLTELGTYELIYRFNDGVRDFYCAKELISKEKYQNTTGVYASMIGEKSTLTITPNVGITTTLYRGEYLQFNEIIDLSRASFQGNYVILSPRFVDTVICFTKLVIKLVDLEDPTNYVLVELLNLGEPSRTFVQAYAYNQEPGTYGNSCICSMFGNPLQCQANIFYDHKGKMFACGDKNAMCGDLDSSSYGKKRWHGFSGDECLMSVYAEEWVEGVESAQLDFDYVDDSRAYLVG